MIEQKQNLLVRCPTFTDADFNNMQILDFGLMTEYVYLDIDERKMFSVSTHEYLIDQVQYFGPNEVMNNVNRTFIEYTNPTKELVWLPKKKSKYNDGTTYICYSNKDDWTPAIIQCSTEILKDSIILLPGNQYIIDSSGDKILVKKGEVVTLPGNWLMFDYDTVAYTPNYGLKIINNSLVNALWLNIDSLLVDGSSGQPTGGGINPSTGASLTATITGSIVVDSNDNVTIFVVQGLSDQSISIPLDKMTDTRINGPHPGICVYQFSNYGLYITGKVNPITHALLQYNGDNRFEKRNSTFFGVLQPYLHHSSTPADGINLYSFAFEPEKHQPSGTSNLSVVDNVVLTLWFSDQIFVNGRTELSIFAFSYNILKVSNGIVGVMY